jgi:2-iminobutanoate/2-iminopropanoate deaminase
MKYINFNFLRKNIMNKSNQIIQSLDSSLTPTAIGPYSKAIKVDMGVNYMIYTSGSLGVNPISGDLLETVKDQTDQCLKNLKNLLE